MSTLHKLSNLEMEVKRTCTSCPSCGLKVKCLKVNRVVDGILTYPGRFSLGYISEPGGADHSQFGLALCSTWFTNICPDEVLPKNMTLTSRRKSRMKGLSNVCPSIICLQLHYASVL